MTSHFKRIIIESRFSINENKGGEKMKMYERIRNYAHTNGIKFNHIADKSGIERKRFYRMINGETTMSADEFERIFIYGLSLEAKNFFDEKFSLNENKINNSA